MDSRAGPTLRTERLLKLSWSRGAKLTLLETSHRGQSFTYSEMLHMIRKFACLLMTGALALGALGCAGEEEKKAAAPASPPAGAGAGDTKAADAPK
jgi:hypothetical protein